MSDPPELAAAAAHISAVLGHDFADVDLLGLALVHRSFAAEESLGVSYERLEFLGDAVLQLAVTHYLYREYPELTEGQMAKVRAAVVNEPTLAEIARRLDLGPLVELGKGETLTGGADKDSILSDVIESVIGAIYLDAGYGAASSIVLSQWTTLIDDRASAPGQADYKTRLQEMLAQQGLRPRYVIDEQGPEHAKRFTAQVFAGDDELGAGIGTSKKRAEQAAARTASLLLDK